MLLQGCNFDGHKLSESLLDSAANSNTGDCFFAWVPGNAVSFALKITNFALTMMNSALQLMNFVLKLMNCVLKLMNFALAVAVSRRRVRQGPALQQRKPIRCYCGRTAAFREARHQSVR